MTDATYVSTATLVRLIAHSLTRPVLLAIGRILIVVLVQGVVGGAAGQVVAPRTLGHSAAHCGPVFAAIGAAQSGAPLQLLPDVGGQEAANALVILALLAQACTK